VGVVLVQACNVAAGEGERTLLAKVRAAHAAAVNSIHSLACDITLSNEPRRPSDCTAAYWQEGKKIRCRIQDAQLDRDILLEGARMTSVSTQIQRGARREPGGHIVEIPGYEVNPNPWFCALMAFFSGKSPLSVSFDQLLAEPHELHSVKAVREDGRDMIHVHLSFAYTADGLTSGKLVREQRRLHLEFWFDPAVNYLVRKHVARDERESSEQTVARFAEGRPGVFFPTLVKGILHQGGKLFTKRTVTITNLKINEPLPDDVFRFRFPPGITIRDDIKQEMRMSDDNGQPSLPAVDKNGVAQKYQASPPQLSLPQVKYTEATQEEEEGQPWRTWLLWFSAFLLLAAGARWFILRRRTARSTLS